MWLQQNRVNSIAICGKFQVHKCFNEEAWKFADVSNTVADPESDDETKLKDLSQKPSEKEELNNER